VTGLVPPAIIVGGGGTNSLGIARTLGLLDIPVYFLKSYPRELTRYSKFCSYSAVIPHIEDDPALLQRVLQQLASRIHTPGVVFPTSDTSVITLSRIQDSLSDYVTYNPPQPIAETMAIKSKFYRSLETHGVPHPKTFDPKYDDVDEITRNLAFPVFVRPAQTLRFLQHFRGKGFIAHNVRELQLALHRAARVDVQVLVQETIPGPTENGYYLIGYLDRASCPLVLVAVQKVRQISMFANTSVDVTIPRSQVQDFEKVLLQYLQTIGYRGLFGAEFKRDPRDGQFKLLEINARSMAGNYLNIAIDVTNILLAYHDALRDPVQPITTYAIGVYLIDVLTDLHAASSLFFHQQLSLRSVLHPYCRRHAYNLFTRLDPLPVLRAIQETVRTVIGRHG
jgi:predicted ATP-grasp superfamily ATP-dependent carboligase